MSGFTLNAVAARIKSIDSGVQWKRYTALALLARLTGQKKSIVETLVFGKDKPSKDFNNAWTRGGKVFAMFLATDRERSAAMRVHGIDDAEQAAIQIILDHMSALEVNGKNAYDQVIEYACKDDIPVAEPVVDEPDADATNAPADATSPADANANEPEMSSAELLRSLQPHLVKLDASDRLVLASMLIDWMSLDDLPKLAIHLADRMAADAALPLAA